MKVFLYLVTLKESISTNQILYKDLELSSQGLSNVTVHDCALSDSTYVGNLFLLGYSSYLEGAQSFIRLSVEKGSDQVFWAPLGHGVCVYDTKTMDPGDIDLLVLTANGSELKILSRLVSRPICIRVKYYCHNQKHWDYYNQVTAWMINNGYVVKTLETNLHNTYYHLECIKVDNL